MLSPPSSQLPSGASKWATVNDVAIRTQKEVRTVRGWCDKGLFFCVDLAGGYGGLWVAVTEDGWPLTNAEGAKAYRAKRSQSAQIGGRLGAARSVAARKARAAKSSRKSTPRRSA